MDADGGIRNGYSSGQATPERFLEGVEDEASCQSETTDDEQLAEPAAVPARAPDAVQRGLTYDFRGIDGYGWWYLGDQVAPLARNKLAATLAAETAAALG